MSSAPQNRFWANGRSFDTHSTVNPLAWARSLKTRTLVAQTGVSTDGKMLSNNGLPRNWSRLTSPRSVPISVNSGAGDPTAGSSPTVLIGFPRMVICAIRTVCQRRLSGSCQGSATTAGDVDVHGVELRRVDPFSRGVDVGA